jgi:hypothetical protein
VKWSAFVATRGIVGLLATATVLQAQSPHNRPAAVTNPPAVQHEDLLALVADIQRADYEAKLDELRTQYDAMPLVGYPAAVEARLRYWKGFAMWRRAINGFNASVALVELAGDTRLAVTEFERAAQLDPQFVDAKIALVSCYQLLTFFRTTSPEQAGELVAKFVPLLKELAVTASNNPRFLWVQGQSEWYTPPGTPEQVIEARQTKALATYERGLAEVRRARSGLGSLDPAWGEPELLMNLAWSNLNRINRDRAAAEAYARQALKLVPHWQYVRDLLLPQIVSGKH